MITGAPTLTSNDLALAQTAIALALAWWKAQPRSGFKRTEIAKLNALNDTLERAGRHLNPYTHSDDIPLDWGDDPVYGPLSKAQQRAAKRAAKRAVG